MKAKALPARLQALANRMGMPGPFKAVPGLIFDHAGWKLLALLTATMIWFLVAKEPEVGMFASVRVEFRNLPRDLEIGSQPAEAISLELLGPSSSLRAMTGSSAPEVVLDMSNVEPGQRTFPIGPSSVRLARGVHFVRSIPSAVRFTFERSGTRFVTVAPRFIGQGKNGYVVDNWTVDPGELAVEGPASHVARISTVTTDPADVSNAIGKAEFRVTAFCDDPYVRFVSAPQITVRVAMKKQ